MPDCLDCSWREDATCRALPDSWSDIPVNLVRACTVAISHEYCSLIAPNTKVLEVGCGTWSPIRDQCLRIGASWEGVDATEYANGVRSLATRIESVEDISFPDETFDLVLGNQTLEHWNEFGCRPERGLWQCFRVCKVGGIVAMNFPIGFHGARIFVEGDLSSIRNLFEPFSSEISMTSWRKNSFPLPHVNLLQGFKHVPGDTTTYQLDVRAVRNEGLSPPPKAYRVRWRPVREVLDHRPTFVFWKARTKLANRARKVDQTSASSGE